MALVNARFLAENPRNPGNSRSSHLPVSLSYLLQKLNYIKTEVNLVGFSLLISRFVHNYKEKRRKRRFCGVFSCSA